MSIIPVETVRQRSAVPAFLPGEIVPAPTAPTRICNFCIIAHIDHGKSTLADRILQLTGIVDEHVMRDQCLDRMDTRRERGITIKSQVVRLPWIVDGQVYTPNMIDIPGHVDFFYEVNRPLVAREGAVLLVGATQGIEAQTLADLYMTLDDDLAIIPVLNKINLPSIQPGKYTEEPASLTGVDPGECLAASGKTGLGVTDLLNRIVAEVPVPEGDVGGPIRAMIFDSVYDTHHGVVMYIRVKDGRLTPHECIQVMSTGVTHELLEIGIISPEPTPTEGLVVGGVGYLTTGVEDVRQSRVGDTMAAAKSPAERSLDGYQDPKPVVFPGVYPTGGSDYPNLRDALDRLRLNDVTLSYKPENSAALGFGFRRGFLGLLHLEVVRERMEREFGIDIIATAPSVVYRVVIEGSEEVVTANPPELPEGKIKQIFEPTARATVLTPSDYTGTIMELCQQRRGTMLGMDYLSFERVGFHYILPPAEIVTDFFDQLKSRTKGYASLDYDMAEDQEADLVKVDVLLNHKAVGAFSAIVYKNEAYSYGLEMTKKLKELIPRQQFEIPVQAATGSRVVARKTVRAMRKDVLAKCYGGDITRKYKLLEKQKGGKKQMKSIGRADVP